MVMGWVRTPVTSLFKPFVISSTPGSGFPVNSLDFFVHFVFWIVFGRSLSRVFGKHSTTWSTLAVFRCSLLNSLAVLYFSSFFIVTLNASFVFSSTSLSKSPPSPNTWSGGISFPFGARTFVYLRLNSVGGYLDASEEDGARDIFPLFLSFPQLHLISGLSVSTQLPPPLPM